MPMSFKNSLTRGLPISSSKVGLAGVNLRLESIIEHHIANWEWRGTQKKARARGIVGRYERHGREGEDTRTKQVGSEHTPTPPPPFKTRCTLSLPTLTHIPSQ